MLFPLSSCETLKKQEKTQTNLFEKAQTEFARGLYMEALQTLLELRQLFPYKADNADVDLLRADIYSAQDLLEEANNHYAQFINLYPKHKSTEYAYYMQVKSWFKRIPEISSRDLSLSSKALEVTRHFLRKFPSSQYRKEIKDIQAQIKHLLRDKELEIAKFYFQKERYVSALGRVEFFIQSYGKGYKYKQALTLGKKVATKLDDQARLRKYNDHLKSL